MAKKIRCDGVELVFFVPCSEIKSYGGGGIERHDKGSPRSIDHAAARANELGRKITKAFGDYEAVFDNFDTRRLTEEVCEHCGLPWTEEGDSYNGCCEKDRVEQEARDVSAGGAHIDTNCGAMYALDEAMVAARAALKEPKP